MILVIDTSSQELLVGIADDDGRVLMESRQIAQPGERGIHDVRLAAETSRLLLELNLQPESITRIGIVIGPGSFTGLRIGLSFAKGFAFATEASIVTLTQHEVLSYELQGEADHIVSLGYRPGLYYVARGSDARTIELCDSLSAVAGTRVLAHTALIGNIDPAFKDASFAAITASVLARLTCDASAAYHAEEIDSLEPLYVTDFSPGKT